MSLKLFEQFLQTEITRHPSLINALKCKGGLRRCSQLFDEAIADLHYRLIRRAVQLLFTRANAARLRQLSVVCDASCSGGGFGDGGADSSCEAKYKFTCTGTGTESSCTATPSQNRDCSPMSSSHCTSQSGDDAICNNDQSNNSQGLKQTPRHGSGLGCCNVSGSCGGAASGNNSRWTRVKEAKQPQLQSQIQHQQPQCHRQQQPQPQQPPPQPCQQQPLQPSERKTPICSGPAPQPSKPSTPPRPQVQPSTALTESPPSQAAMVREGPAYNYPTAGRHNRQAMAGWYVANMDALLSNLMRLFEKIYADTLCMCGASPVALQELRNALPDPTLISMQQRAGGAWRPNYMTCKIDFLLHIAAMVYRNTQDLRCGCQCAEPADPCTPWTVQPQSPQQQRQQQRQPQRQQLQQQQPQLHPQPNFQQPSAIMKHGHTENRNNAAAAAVVTADELEDLPSRYKTLPEQSSWEQSVVLNSSSNARRRLEQHRDREGIYGPTLQPQSQQQQSVMAVYKTKALVKPKDNRTSGSATSAATSLQSAKSGANVKRPHRRQCQKPKKKQPPYLLAVKRSSVVISEDIARSSSDDGSTAAKSIATSDSDTSDDESPERTDFRLSIDVN